MKPERWQQLDQLFHSALRLEPDERTAFLVEACAGDESLRRQVEALLAAHEEAGSFIESPTLEVETRGLAADQGTTEGELATGELISHYRIIALVGVGGMGQVYLAQDITLGRKIALKLLPCDFTRDVSRVRRFQQEARAASSLNHPNILTVYEIGAEDGRQFIATEFIDGQSLRQHMRRLEVQLSEVLEISIQVASALAAAHEAGIVHRDIKPENIMLRKDGVVKVLDFGLAKLIEEKPALDTEAPTRALANTAAGVVMGTVNYMSPEQARGTEIDPRADIWSLGVVLYEMVAGRMPFSGDTTSDVIAGILKTEPPLLNRYVPDVPAELERIVTKALRKEKDERYQVIKDLGLDLKSLKQRLEFEVALERTGQPDRHSEGKQAATSGSGTINGTTEIAAAQTGGVSGIRTTPSVQYMAGEIKRHKLGVALILALLITIAAAYRLYFADRGKSEIDSIAVLPFVNESNDLNLEYLSDGITESVINNLSQLRQLKVIARSSAFKYKGKQADPQEASKALGVRAIVIGRVLQRGDSLQVSVELVDAHNNTQLWGEQYNRKATDLLALQSEISREITEKLRLRLSTGEQRQLAKPQTADPAAYEFLLKGRFYWNKGGPENQKKAAECFNQAIAADPNYALAYAELSNSYSFLVAASILDPKEFTPKAEAAAQKALELDEGLANAHFALANLKTEAWDWAAAEREYKRAIELNPNLAEARFWYCVYLTFRGRPEEAIAEIKRAKELDPLSLFISAQIGWALFTARQYHQAIEALKKVLELDRNFPDAHIYLGYSYAANGQYLEAIAAYQEAIRLGVDDPSVQISLGAAYAQAGERGKAQAILKRLQRSDQYVSPGELAKLHAALGEREQAFASLEKAYAMHDLQLGFLGVDPEYDSLRSDPRFTALMRRVGLAP